MELIMTFIVNGKEHNMEIKTLVALMAHYRIDPLAVVVEKNGVIVHRENYDATFIEDGDSFEIVRFVGGG